MPDALTRPAQDFDKKLLQSIQDRGLTPELQEILMYAAGIPKKGRAPKRLRPQLLLHIAALYGVRSKSMQAALAIELFHAFTLVHDDIADRDAMRRGQPTIWKKWGIEKALNAGDTLAFLAMRSVLRIEDQKAREALGEAFITICEGQQLDFEFTSKDFDEVRESRYMEMIEKKTAALFRIAAAIPAMVSGMHSEKKKLEAIGLHLGLAFQMADDYRSLWASQARTGKDSHSDIREKKRTLPLLLAYQKLDKRGQAELQSLFSTSKSLSKRQISRVMQLIDETDARVRMKQKILSERSHAIAALRTLRQPQSKLLRLQHLIEGATAIPD